MIAPTGIGRRFISRSVPARSASSLPPGRARRSLMLAVRLASHNGELPETVTLAGRCQAPMSSDGLEGEAKRDEIRGPGDPASG